MSALAAVCLAAALLMAPGPGYRRMWRQGAAPTESADAAPDRPPDPHAMPASFDLFAACLRAGMPAATAARAVAESAPPALATALRRGADRLQLGADPADAWTDSDHDEVLEDFARAARRSAKSGAPLSETVSELAVRLRSEAEDRASAAIERAGVLVSGPLGLCFLPAFVCLGIVPVVMGLARDVLGGGLL
ncbi:type II secretion system F family protein [Rhodococcus chondri]|uniref:Type II secretion system F family protein n=1 Tax=Rhodococcus chondri TaxID=3065941 RepID=A0ABU7JWR3_9NOCA|nr:type II secretion system F family protein [Rhodococcus sp. CC-R104]MEE2034460.1 type II secretion system F family protein [Rhodococcus sp. CC-R104]